MGEKLTVVFLPSIPALQCVEEDAPGRTRGGAVVWPGHIRFQLQDLVTEAAGSCSGVTLELSNLALSGWAAGTVPGSSQGILGLPYSF